MTAARQTVGDDIDLMLDTNCAWLPDQVIDWVRALEPIGLKWLEEPVYPTDDFTTMARIRAETGMPVASFTLRKAASSFTAMSPCLLATYTSNSLAPRTGSARSGFRPGPCQ
jgi:hypothetical protein